MGGVINIITRKPVDKPVSFTAKGGYGTWDTWDGGATLSGKVKRFGYCLAYKHLESDGYNPTIPEERGLYDIDRYLEEDHVRTKFTFDVTEESTLSVGYLHFEDKRGEGEKIRHPDGVYRSWDTNGVNADYNWVIDESQWQLSGFYNKEYYFWNRERMKKGKYTWYHVDVDRIDAGASLQTTLPINSRLLLTTGVDYRHGSVDGADKYIIENDAPSDTVVTNKGKQDSYSIFVNNEIQMGEKAILHVGARYDYVKSHDGSYHNPTGKPKSQDYDDETWNRLSPKAALLYHLTDVTSLRASVGTAFRAPILDDLYRSGIFRGRVYEANPKLGPEKTISYEVGISHSFTKEFSVNLTGYYTEVEDFFYAVEIGTKLYQRQNVGKVKIHGVELEADYHMNSWLSAFGNLTWNHSEIDEFQENPELEGKVLEYTPRYKANMGLSLSHPNICQVELVGRYVDEMFSDPENTEEDKLDDYFVVDLKISREFTKHVKVFLDITDLFDKEYKTSSDSLSPGRYIYGGVTLRF